MGFGASRNVDGRMVVINRYNRLVQSEHSYLSSRTVFPGINISELNSVTGTINRHGRCGSLHGG